MVSLLRSFLGAALFATLLAAVPAEGKPAPWATGESQPEDLRIFLVTFGPGDEVFSWFGHTALGVEDTRLKEGRLYNYGMFAFSRTMVVRFTMGRLEFWVGEDPVNRTLRLYARDDRDVRVQELNLAPAQRKQVADFLANNVKRENRTYLYDHYFDNCSTRPRDVIDLAVGGQLSKAMGVPGRMSLRDHTRRYSAVFPPLGIAMDLGMAASVDRPLRRYDEAFLPLELERQLDDFSYVDANGATVPLVSRKWTYHQSTTRSLVPEEAPSYVLPLGLFGLLLGGGAALLAWRGRSHERTWARRTLGGYTAAVGFVFGLLGVVLALLWGVTDHVITYRNTNLLLVNPLTLAALPLGIAFARRKAWAVRALPRVWGLLAASAAVTLLLRLLGVFSQDNLEFIALFLPLNAGFAAAFTLHARAVNAVSVDPSQPLGAEENGTGRIAANH